YTLTTSDAHKYLRVVVTANDGKGGTPTATSAYTAITNSAPVNSAAPNVTGTATVGNALTTTNGSWSDADGDGRSYSYQWYRADDSNGTNAASISGATSSSYTLTTSDAHKYLRVVVTANDGKGGTPTATSAYTAILNSAPVNSAAPNVTGTATVGNALTTTNGSWSDADGDGRSYSYQWYRADDSNGTNAASISGATSSSYTLTTSDAHKYLRVVVTANDGKGGTPTATSTYTAILNSAPVNSAAPNVTGTATVGNALTTTNGTWSDADGDGRSYSYQWYRADDSNGTNAASISGATSSSYTLTTSDAHKYLRVVVTANDGKGGTPTATSAYTAITNSLPVNSAVPSVSGTATVGNALTTTNGSWSDADGDGRSYSYQWYRADDSNGTNAASISGATSSSYTLTTSDAHKYLRVVVTANDGKGGTPTATSTYTAILNSAPMLSTDARSLTTIEEDATGNNGDTVASILASSGSATDVDGNPLGIAITATDTSNGMWQYKTGAGNWTTITGVSGTSALLLASTDRVRFVPNTDFNGSVANGITFKAWDQTAGTAGTTVGNDTTANGGQGNGRQFSADSATAGLAVTAMNDAPVLTDTVLTLPSVAQAAGAPNGAVGVAVSSLVALGANVSDVDSGAVTGIALVGVDTSEGGTWFYSTDGGTSWTAVGTVNDSGNALLLRTTDRLYYQPTGANAGTLGAAITFRAWDQSSGTAGAKVATTGGGGTSAFSTATDTASLSITPAALASAVTLAAESDTGISNSDNITKASSVTFNGSGANANTTVRLYANGSLLATATSDASGAYSFTGVDVSGVSGAVDFTVRQAVAGMESADSAVRTVTFDRTAPAVAITTVTGDNVLNAAESAVTQTVAGTTTGVENGQTVTVTLNGKTYSTTVTNNAWSLSVPTADLQALTDGGTYAITADLTDVAGNAAVQATRNVSVDRTPPTLVIATVAGDNVLNAADSAVGQTVAGVTNGVENGQTVTVTLNGKAYSTTVTNNRWSLTVPPSDLLALTDGANYTVTASLTDAAGNPTQATRSVSVDRTPPSVVSVTPPPARTYLPGETVSFYVQLSEASIISGGNPVLELAVGSEIRNAAYNVAGSTGTLLRFDYVVPVGDRAPQGIAVLGLALNGSIVTDAAQGPLVTTLKGVGDTSQVLIDTPIPAKPVGTALSGLSDSGASATDRLTNVTRPTLSGTAEANATVTVLVDGKAVGTTVADENGFWVHRLQTALTDGTHSITTTATNRFGIVSDPSDALAVLIDTAVPVAPAPSVTSATVAGAAAGERISGIATPSLAGTTEAGSMVSLLVDGKVAGTAVADANGAWTFQFTTALADGTHSLQVQATDRAGNVSSLSAVTTLTIDTTPPAAPTVTLNTTAGSTPVVQGTAEANSLVSVTINGQTVGTARASATGAWQLALAADLSVGSYVISAKASDAVGNTGNAGTTTYSVAPPPPPPAVVVAASTGNTTTAASSSNSVVATAAGTGTTQTTGPTLGTAPTLPGLQTSSDAGRVITSSSIGSGSAAGNGNSSTDAGRSITIGNIGNSTSSDAGRSITISAMGGAPSGGGTASSSSGVLGGGTAGASGSGLSGVVSGGSGLGSSGLGGGLGGGGLGGSSGLGGSGLGGATSGGLGATGAGVGGGAFGGAAAGGGQGAGLGVGGAATGTGTGNGGLNGGVGGPGGPGGASGAAGAASGSATGGSSAPGGPGTATGGLGSAPGNRPGGQTGPGSTIENAPANRPAGPQGQPQGQGQGQQPAGDAPTGGDPGNAPAAPDGQGQTAGPRADLDGTSPARPAFSRQVAQIHGAADAQTAALLAALTTHVPPGSRAA
ncbi:beta strand repeat-containing protein, partial [Azospirillum himalayense]